MGGIKLHDISNLSMHLPCTLFETLHRFNDTSADDMKYGDMDERQLRALGLDDISVRVDPYRLIRYDFPKPENYRQFENGFSFRPVEGLDINDIHNSLYRNFRFFRIWFFLQRHRDFAFKPFFTNFNADIMVKG
ncbi:MULTISPECIES: DUF3289 family protein [Enterobacterales]|uniref:DUF3289 family protein n=1 Tax=Enterobacterales TaxID=91347 RepID=UPI002ED7B97A